MPDSVKMDSTTVDPAMRPTPLVSIADTAKLSDRPLTHAQDLSRAALLGPAFTVGKIVYHLEAFVTELSARHHWTEGELLGAVRERRGNPDETVVVIRQRARQEEPGELRGWYGYDRRYDSPEDESRRSEQDNAMRMWWPVNEANVKHVAAAQAAGRTLPLIVTVGGLIATCRDITGLDFNGEKHNGRMAFTVAPADSWADGLVDTWFITGPGRPVLWLT